jgi:hypothetical protein
LSNRAAGGRPLLAGSLAALALLAGSGKRAFGEPATETTRMCLNAHESAQELEKKDDLLAAREALQVCAAAACPSMIQTDCTTWLAQNVEATPSVLLGATVDGEYVFDVTVTIDGNPLVRRLDGRSVEVNPGLHAFVFERSGSPPIRRMQIIAEHDHGQMVAVEWNTAPAAGGRSGGGEGAARATEPPAPSGGGVPPRDRGVGAPPGAERPVPALTFVLGGVTVAGLATFAILGLTGSAKQHDLDTTCSPRCPAGDVTSLQNRFIAADIALGVGALSAVGAVVVFLTRPERAASQPRAAEIRVRPLVGGGGIDWSQSF